MPRGSNGLCPSMMALTCSRWSPSYLRHPPVTPSAESREVDRADCLPVTEAVEALETQVRRGFYVHNSAFYAVLKRCIAQKNFVLGSRVHALAITGGYEEDTFLANHIICMYASHGRLEEATLVFNRVPVPSRYMWASIILAYARHGQPKQAIELYRLMCASSVNPDDHIFVAVLKACAEAEDLRSGRDIHATILRSAEKPNVFVGNCLISMYVKCGSLKDARTVFESLRRKNVVTWTAMITGYAQHGLGEEALNLYAEMQELGISSLSQVTYVSLLQACAGVGALHHGKQLHAQIQGQGLETDVVVGTCLVDMYAKCGRLDDARAVFDSLPNKNVVTWNAIITGYAQNGMGQTALSVYDSMQQEGITTADGVTFVCLLQACSSVSALEKGRRIHAEISRTKLESADIFVANALIDMYCKCGSMLDAQETFDALPRKDVVTWNALIAGYAHQGDNERVFDLYKKLRQGGVQPSSITFVCLLQACGNAAGLEKGMEIHAEITTAGPADSFLANCLVDMYGKCGSMVDARKVFDACPTRDTVTWNALMAGYARQGEDQLVFDLFEEMIQQSIQPDDITFLSLLTVCSHAGLVRKGWTYFEAMNTDYHIIPTMQHYNCMVDLLGRAGQLENAIQMVKNMPFQPHREVLRSMLGACRKWKNVEIGKEVFEQAVRLDQSDPAAYVVMSSIYSAAHLLEEAKEIQAMRFKAQAWKKPGVSWWTDINGTVHTFLVGNAEHDEAQKLFAKLADLFVKIKAEGYLSSAR